MLRKVVTELRRFDRWSSRRYLGPADLLTPHRLCEFYQGLPLLGISGWLVCCEDVKTFWLLSKMSLDVFD